MTKAESFDLARQHGFLIAPLATIDDVLANPRHVLTLLCRTCGVPFADEMLGWPKGPKPYDGVWAPHWYNAVWQSTGFEEPPSEPPALPPALAQIAEEARPYYERLSRFRLR